MLLLLLLQCFGDEKEDMTTRKMRQEEEGEQPERIWEREKNKTKKEENLEEKILIGENNKNTAATNTHTYTHSLTHSLTQNTHTHIQIFIHPLRFESKNNHHKQEQ